MELSPSSEAANCAATQQLPSILWNPKVHYRVHKSPPLVSIPSQLNHIHTIPSHPTSLRSILILPTHLRLGLLTCFFPSAFPTNNLYAFLFFPFVLLAVPVLPSLTWSFDYTWRRGQVMKLLIMQFSPTSRHFISLRYKYSPQHPANTLSLCSSLNVRD
jgi:hypothetical protein